eukprot:9205550-Heterocapsa_arctica.AAC.1
MSSSCAPPAAPALIDGAADPAINDYDDEKNVNFEIPLPAPSGVALLIGDGSSRPRTANRVGHCSSVGAAEYSGVGSLRCSAVGVAPHDAPADKQVLLYLPCRQAAPETGTTTSAWRWWRSWSCVVTRSWEIT